MVESIFDNIEILIDSKPIKVHKTYTSKYPINVRWPGHQRQEYQRVPTCFVSFESSKSVDILVKLKTDVKRATLRPQSIGGVVAVDGGNQISFTLNTYGGYVLELDNFQYTIHFFYNQPKEYNIDRLCENTIYFGAGEHDVGVLQLKSNQTIYLHEDAIVYCCIHANQAENIRILGRGIIDNSKNKEKILNYVNSYSSGVDVNNAKREHTIHLINCQNVQIDGIIIKDSLLYNIGVWGGLNFAINNVKIVGCWRYNSDGIDLHNVSNVKVTNCFVRTFDDSICVKGHLGYTNLCQNIVIDNCVVWNDWGHALHVGVESCAKEMHDITFQNCFVIRAQSSALGIGNVDYGIMHNITYKNIQIEMADDYQSNLIQTHDDHTLPALKFGLDNKLPPFIWLMVWRHYEYSVGEKEGQICNINFENINIYAPKLPPIEIVGISQENPISNITLKDIKLNGIKITEFDDLVFTQKKYCENITII